MLVCLGIRWMRRRRSLDDPCVLILEIVNLLFEVIKLVNCMYPFVIVIDHLLLFSVGPYSEHTA